jgi:hypothetical protein
VALRERRSQLSNLCFWQRPAVQKALRFIAALTYQMFELGLSLDTLGDRSHAEYACQADHGGNQRTAPGVLRQATREGAVDLQRGDRQLRQTPER